MRVSREELLLQNPKFDINNPTIQSRILSFGGPYKNKYDDIFYYSAIEILSPRKIFHRRIFSKLPLNMLLEKCGKIGLANLAKFNNEEFIVLRNENIDVAFRLRIREEPYAVYVENVRKKIEEYKLRKMTMDFNEDSGWDYVEPGCQACGESPCMCSDPDRTSTL